MPPWEVRIGGFEIPNPFFPGVLLPGITFTVLYLWPYIEERFTRDHAEHHLLDRPRERPLRTAIGVAVLAFYVVLFLAGGNDVIAAHFDLSVNAVTYVFRTLLFVLPAVAALVAYRLCKELTARDQHREEKLASLERTVDGGYVDVDAPSSSP
jgi:ubiquinol-cytochrome c reductase cytochrome b subunit